MKIVTWNVNSIRSRHPRIVAWVVENQPDVLCMQELKCEDDGFPHAPFEAAGYHVVTYGQKTWNGVAIAAKKELPITDVMRGLPDGGDETQSRIIQAVVGGVRIMNVYVPNGEAPNTGKFAYKLGWMQRLTNWLTARRDAGEEPHVLLGDFNVGPGDLDVFDPILRKETIHVSTPEREALAKLMAVGYEDMLRKLHPDLRVFTFWDYRMLAFPKNKGFRIDHVLCRPETAAQVKSIIVDRNARKGQGASDHAPVIAELA